MWPSKLRSFGIIFFLFVLGFFSRYLLKLEQFSSFDSAQYGIATFYYSIADKIPQAPGYFLYIMSGKLLTFWVGDPYTAFILLSAFYSGLCAVMFYLLGRKLFSESVGFTSAIIFLSSPIFWYRGVTVYGYLNAAFFLLLTGYFCYLVMLGKSRSIYCASIAYGICIGVRPQEVIALLPLYLFVWSKVTGRQKLISAFLFGLTCLAWFIPLTSMSGGIWAYAKAVIGKDSNYLASDSVFQGAFFAKIQNHLFRMFVALERAYFLALIPLLYGIGHIFYLPNLLKQKNIQFLVLFMSPILLFNIFIQFGDMGHGLGWGLSFCLIIAEAIRLFAQDLERFLDKGNYFIRTIFSQRMIMVEYTTLCALFNSSIFFHDFHYDIYQGYYKPVFDDRYFNYTNLKNIDRHLTQKITYIREHFKPEETVFLSKLFFRQLSFIFPKAHVIRSDLLRTNSRPTLYVCYDFLCKIYSNHDSFLFPKEVKQLVVFDDIDLPFVLSSFPIQEVALGKNTHFLIVDIAKAHQVHFSSQKIFVE